MKLGKKTLGAIAVAVLIVAGGYVWWNISTQKTFSGIFSNTFLGDAGTRPLLSSGEDTDSDGLADWEEVLWKTNPENPDTDGDGMSDGKEVKEVRNPIIFGAGTLETNLDETNISDLTTTELISKEILNTYIKLKAQGETGLSTGAESPSDIIAKNVPPLTSEVFSIDDFTTTNETRESVTSYAITFRDAFRTRFNDNSEGELDVLYRGFKTEDAQVFNELHAIAEKYRDARDELLSLPVPRNIVQPHRDLVNALSLVAKSIDSMAEFRSDPIVGVQGIQTYFDVRTVIETLITEIETYVMSVVVE